MPVRPPHDRGPVARGPKANTPGFVENLPGSGSGDTMLQRGVHSQLELGKGYASCQKEVSADKTENCS